jgi:predicted CXXCH cytochrome family protein
MRHRLLAVYATLAALVAGAAWFALRDRHAVPATAPAPRPAPASYVGSAACAACHEKETHAWRGSQHELAMQPATDATVLGDFAARRHAAGGVASTFSRRDGGFVVNTEGPDGKLADYAIKYTFGVYPLQQYLVDMGGGRLQALGIAWDARPKSQGGQRWFRLYPDRRLRAGDPLHWTGIDQNWNYQCADCHSTNLRKGYDDQTGKFATTWTDMSVGCEACHGPGSNHVAWAQRGADDGRDTSKGLLAALDERHAAVWTIDAASGNATRSRPRTSSREIEACARCHARRGQFSDAWHAGQPLGDAFRPALISAGLYHPDGQQRDEVYTYGSFLQSKMHAKGVTCSDCHDPHSQKLRADGNAVCAQCHAAAKYDAPVHTRHSMGSAGGRCAACHMPTTTYMLVDPRHDHSLRIPRPDRSVTMGVPNACNGCHADRSPKWAADRIAGWFPQPKAGFQSFGEAFQAADRGAPGVRDALIRIVEDRAQPAFVRASAVERLGRAPGSGALPALQVALNDGDFLVRVAAVQALSSADAGTRSQLLPPLLEDPVRLVRIDAARALAGEAESRLSPADRMRFERGLDEYVAAQRFNADRPEAHAALGNLYAARGQTLAAEASYRKAMAIDPTFVQAALNLADLQRALGRDDAAERTIREVLKRSPQSAPAHHALGLTLVRAKRVPEALAELAAAARLGPDEARFAYVYAVALHDTGNGPAAVRALHAALGRNPYDRDVLMALATYESEAGDAVAARERARLLRQLEPDDPGIAQLEKELERTAR